VTLRQPLLDLACYYSWLKVCEAKAINISVKNTDHSPDAQGVNHGAKAPRVKVSLNGVERRIVAALAGIYATRMLGLFLLLPVLAIYATQLPDASPRLIGLAMGAYGLTQALLQIPFGRWSDRYGRRPVIAAGLLLFLIGSVVGAFANTLWMVVLARSLQGAGAMSAAVTALLADFTREAVRTRAMAFIGISIGTSFVVSLIAAPLLEAVIGVQGIFWVMALLAVMGLALLRFAVPAKGEQVVDPAAARIPTLRVAALPSLRAYFVGVFALHFILTATFLSVPLVLLNRLAIAEAMHWKIYLGVFLASFIGTVPLILAAERVTRPQLIIAASVLVAALAQTVMAMAFTHSWAVFSAFTVFFAVFNFLEARLPAGLSKAAPTADRGAAMGVFATCQFLGAACGGVIGGQLLQHFGEGGVFWGSALVALIWATITALAPVERKDG
jgi:MFS family permease